MYLTRVWIKAKCFPAQHDEKQVLVLSRQITMHLMLLYRSCCVKILDKPFVNNPREFWHSSWDLGKKKKSGGTCLNYKWMCDKSRAGIRRKINYWVTALSGDWLDPLYIYREHNWTVVWQAETIKAGQRGTAYAWDYEQPALLSTRDTPSPAAVSHAVFAICYQWLNQFGPSQPLRVCLWIFTSTSL